MTLDTIRAGDDRAHVAVVGAGWAGCAAAVQMAARGVAVTLYEHAPMLGGRARTIAVDGLHLDNGQHLLVGAYHHTLAALERVHGQDRAAALLQRIPLTIAPWGSLAQSMPAFAAARWPAPWHLASAVLLARGLAWGERLALLRHFRGLQATNFERPDAETVEACFARVPRRSYAALWAPLCVAALNTPPSRASARIFGNVLRAALAGSAGDSEFILPREHLGALLPEPAGAFVTRHGGTVRVSTRVRAILDDATAITVAADGDAQRFDAVVLAAGPHQVRGVDVHDASGAWFRVQTQIAAFQYESINTVYLGYPQATMATPLARLDDTPGQWLFDRGLIEYRGELLRLLALVVSANGPHDALAQDSLVAAADAQLRRLDPTLPARRYGRVIAERRATYACTPGLERPAAGGITARLHLAGDYTHLHFPATLEAAVVSGTTAADSALAAIASRRRQARPQR
ncbi:MAG: hydroxysqualene dehydroxylase HpnE [Casimicrobiaceae bacterium]